MRKYWIKILKTNLLRDPAYYSNDKLYKKEHRNDFFTPENLIVNIKTKAKHYNFGGPIYTAKVSLSREGILVVFVPPKYMGKQQYDIKWEKISSINISFFPKNKFIPDPSTSADPEEKF